MNAESIADDFGVPFQIFSGVSNNARTFWNSNNARRIIDYQPQDDSEIIFAADIATMLARLQTSDIRHDCPGGHAA